MAAGRHLLAFALFAVIYSGIAVDASKDKAVLGVKEIGNYNYIAWRVAPKKKVWAKLCPSSAPSEKLDLGLAWYGFDNVQNKFDSFKDCSKFAKNETGNWTDYTEMMRYEEKKRLLFEL